jgi:TPP-dependent pyruvate/acetoin dehydrogenase alpha subunit
VARFRAAIESEIEDAVAFAEAAPWPEADQLLTHVL